jgi:small-conductance mechanosensitive channel
MNIIMEIAKPIFIIVASITLFGILGGLDPSNTIFEMGLTAVVVGLIFAGLAVLREVKDQVLARL